MNSEWDKYCLFHGKISLLALLLNFFDFYIEFYAVKAPYSKLQIIRMWLSLANQLCTNWTLISSLWCPLYQPQCNCSTSCFCCYLFIYPLLSTLGLHCLPGLSLVVASGAHSSSKLLVSFLWVFFGLQHAGFSSCSIWALEQGLRISGALS